ncbi:hypothetical protein GCM10029992_31310 [Glycomyces albus]
METDTQLEAMVKAEAPLVQGYLLARPMPADELTRWHRGEPPAIGAALTPLAAARHPSRTVRKVDSRAGIVHAGCVPKQNYDISITDGLVARPLVVVLT